MFKPFVIIATCCDTIFHMRRPSDFKTCICEKVSVDAGDGYEHCILGDTKYIHYVKDTRDSDLLLHWDSIESCIADMSEYEDLSKFNVDGCRDIHSLIAKRTGKSRQDAKDLLYMYNYTQNTGVKDILFRSKFNARGSK